MMREHASGVGASGMGPRVAWTLALAVVVAGTADAAADGAPADAAADGAPADAAGSAGSAQLSVPGSASLALSRGHVVVAASAEISLSTRAGLEPVSVAPDVYYGVTDAIAVGVIHSARARGLIDSGSGACVTGADRGCPRPYDNVGVDYLHAVWVGRAADRAPATATTIVAGHARVLAGTLDPFELTVTAGALARIDRGRLSVTVDPHLALAVAGRDSGNRGFASVPVWVHARIAGGARLSAQTGVRGPLSGFGDEYAVPVALGLVYGCRTWEAGAQAGFPALVGAFTRHRSRHLAVHVSVRLGT